MIACDKTKGQDVTPGFSSISDRANWATDACLWLPIPVLLSVILVQAVCAPPGHDALRLRPGNDCITPNEYAQVQVSLHCNSTNLGNWSFSSASEASTPHRACTAR